MSPTSLLDTSDNIVPLHFFDDITLWRAFILYSTFVFDCVLDVAKLRSSLEYLAHQDGWWKLGARLKKTEKGALEYHVPRTFTADSPAIAFSHIHHNVDSSEHPMAAQFPRPSVRPALVGNPDAFRDLVMPTGGPKKLNDFTNSDRPQLGLHIITFGDLTVVTLYFPHTLMDAMGQKALLDAWCLVLNGEVCKVRTPHGADTDPLATLGMTPFAEHKLASRQLSMLGLIGYGLGQAMKLFRTQESRMVCVPQQTVVKVHKEVMVDLGSPHSGHAVPSPFLSDGDILCAWWTRIVLSQLSPCPTQTVVLNNAYDIRRSLQEDLIPGGSPYISNAIGFVPVILTAKDILEMPLSYTALAIRNAITGLGTREQVEAFFSLWRRNPGNLPPLFGDRNMRMITFSNWTKADLYELDFSAAIAKGYDTKVAKPRYIQNTQSGLTLPNAFPIIGKDGQGNYWLSGYMDKAHWAVVEEELAAAKG